MRDFNRVSRLRIAQAPGGRLPKTCAVAACQKSKKCDVTMSVVRSVSNFTGKPVARL
jgi:hypothetical protein